MVNNMPPLPSHSDQLAEALAHSPGYLLNHASRLLRARMESALAPLELTLYEYVTLRLIALGAPLSQGMLGETYGIDRTTMVALVDRLEKRELMERERSQTDRRRYTLKLTSKGRKLLPRAQRIAQQEQRAFLSAISDSDWEQARQCLWQLICANQ